MEYDPRGSGGHSGLRSDNPQAYIPGDRRRALAEGRELPDRVNGAALFADISGFTPLAEALAAELGPERGAEELAAALDDIVAALLNELDRHGGDVIYFSGDAVTAWIDGDDGSLALACGLAMQQVMLTVGERRTPGGRSLRLGLKVAVAAGPARRFVVGTQSVQLIDVLAGSLMDVLAEAEHEAARGEVVLSAATAEVLADRVDIAARRGAGVAVVAALTRPVVLPPPRSALPNLEPAEVRKWLLPRVFERMSAGDGEFLAELRPGVPLFLRFGGIDYDNDPDAVRQLDDLVTRAQLIVDAHGGNVLQLTIGDKGAYLYAVFGAPVAHEDDAARACASALELARLGELTAATGLQIGISAGRLRSGTYGPAERRTFCCLGDPVNLAARLMTASPAGGILVAAEVRRAAGRLFEWGAPTPLRVAGKTAEVVASPLLARRDDARPWDEPGGDDDRSPLVGRDVELGELRDVALRALSGAGQVAVVTGVGGVGKTRLLEELAQWLGEQGIAVGVAAAPGFGDSTSYAVWQRIVRAAWRLSADTPPDELIERLGGILDAAAPALRPRLPLLGTLLGVAIPDTPLTASFDARLRKTSLESLVIDLLSAAAGQSPVVLLIDSAEHLDELSWELAEAIGRAAARLPLLLVLAGRPPESEVPAAAPVEAQADAGSGAGSEAGAGSVAAPAAPYLAALASVHRLDVAALDADDGAEMVQALFRLRGRPPVDTSAAARIADVGGGNPFHLEELVNYVIEGGLDPAAELGLPTRLHTLELARIDALSEQPRRSIKVASVIGTRFRTADVAGAYPDLGGSAEVDRQLIELDRAALVQAEEPSRRRYAFRNVTIAQVAYETLPFATRSALHDRVLDWFEATEEPDTDARVDRLAFHAARGTDDVKVGRYVVRAGVAAQARYANQAAVEYFNRAIPAVDPDERGALLLRLGQVLEISGRWGEAEAARQQAAELYLSRGERGGWANAQADLAEGARKQGRFDEARGLLLAANEVYLELADQAGQGNVLHLLGTLASQQSDYDEARRYYGESLRLRTELDDQLKIGALLSNLAVVAEQLGEFNDARDLNTQALAVRTAVGDPWAMAVSHNNLGMIALLQEDFAAAAGHIDESMRLADAVGDRWIVAVGQHNQGIARRGLGEFAASGEAFAAALAAYVEHHDRWSLALLAEDVAYLAVDTAQDLDALRLVAAADGLRAELAAPRSPAPEQALQSALQPARDRLSVSANTSASTADSAIDQAVSEAKQFSFDQVVELIASVCQLG